MKKKDLIYTGVIVFAVILALCFPGWFLEIRGYKLAGLITPLLQIIMFGMGTSMSVRDFAGVIRTPKGVIIGVFSHYLIMPLLGFTLASISGLPSEIAAGIVLIGCSPNGMASNVISYLARANVALSITITAVSTLDPQHRAGTFVVVDGLVDFIVHFVKDFPVQSDGIFRGECRQTCERDPTQNHKTQNRIMEAFHI